MQRLLASADREDREIIDRAVAFSMTGIPRMLALLDAVTYCEARRVPGAFAECGVWRGGSVLVMILKLLALGVDDREIYLYDTFEGMPEPSAEDFSVTDGSARTEWEAAHRECRRPWEDVFGHQVFDLESVRGLLMGTGYPPDRLHFVAGRVEETVPARAPDALALLRLDTDWYESTRHELVHLFPRLQPGGVLIVDDYGHWEGARRAVDEYFGRAHPPLLLGRLDYSARMGVKQ